MSRFQFAWFRRWRKWIALAVVLLLLPMLTVCYLEYHKKTLVLEIVSTGAAITVEPAVPWLPAVLNRVGISLPGSCWHSRYTEVSTREGDTQSLSRQEMQRIVDAANDLRSVRLVTLWNPAEPLDAASIEPLRELETLTSLNLECGLHDDALQVVSGIVQLRELRLLDASSELTGEGYAALAKLQHLERLHIVGSELTRDDLEEIAQIRGLQTLILESCFVRDVEGMHALADLPYLDRLSIVDSFRRDRNPNAAFAADSIAALTKMPALKELRVGCPQGLPPEFVARLKAALSAVSVTECRPYKFEPW